MTRKSTQMSIFKSFSIYHWLTIQILKQQKLRTKKPGKVFVHMRPEPTLGEPTTSIFPYPLPQIHDYTGQPEEENIKSLPVLVELKHFSFYFI